jgi:hypothetical protein
VLVVFRRGTLSWTSACAAMPEVVSCTQDKVVVGLTNGTLSAYAP